MSNILDQIQSRRQRVRPANEAEFIALQISRALKNEHNASDFLLLSHRYTIPALIQACAAVRPHSKRGWPAIDHFRAVLEEQSGKEPGFPNLRLLSVRIERRCIAISYFQGLHLEYARTRNIPAAGGEDTVSAFLQWALAQFKGASVALEQSAGDETKRDRLTDKVVECVRTAGVPLWEIPESELFQAFGHPPAKTRGQFRASANHLWPTLRTRFCGRAGVDAAGLALLVQSKRLLNQTEAAGKSHA